MDTATTVVPEDVTYPESDGKPMADNTLQWDWMVKIVGELKEMFAGQNVFVAGNLFWYPVRGDRDTVTAPDGLVVFGRPPGYRGSYKQWEEDGIAPHVVFEILSPNNTREEMEDKLEWYDRYGVEEYYFIDPYKNQLQAWVRRKGRLRSVYPVAGFVSPRLGIRFDVNGEVKLFRPDGREFLSREERVSEMEERISQERLRSDQRMEEERRHAEQRMDEERRRAEALAAKLRELGINPDTLPR